MLGFAFRRADVACLFGSISEGFSFFSFGISGARAAITDERKDKKKLFDKGRHIFASKAFTGLFSGYIKDGFCGGITKFDADAIAAFMDKCIEIIGNYDYEE